MSKTIQLGSRVTLHYTLSLGDGTIVDSASSGEPATFTMGSGELVELLERKLLGLKSGDSRHLVIGASESQMSSTAETVQVLARSDFPVEMILEPGQLLGFETPDGQEVPGLIVSVSAAEVRVDFSHPLAGRDLVFDVEILVVE